MRKLRTALLALGATAAVIGGGFAGVPAAQAATTWQAFDKNCRDIKILDGSSAGTACAQVQKRVTDTGSITGYRARLILTPAEGHSLKATTHTWGSDGATYPICPEGCAPQTAAWNSAWTPVKTTASSYIARGELADGSFDVAASWSEWRQVAGNCDEYAVGKLCVYRHDRAYRDTYEERGKLTVTPSAGNWMEPRQVRVGIVWEDGADTHKVRGLCDPSCTRHTTYWSATVTRTIRVIGEPDQYYASAQVAFPSGDVKFIRASAAN